jgi:hypothetical protein
MSPTNRGINSDRRQRGVLLAMNCVDVKTIDHCPGQLEPS